MAHRFEKYLILAARYYFGAHTFISGINHYLLFFSDPLPMKPEMTGRFMTVLVDSCRTAIAAGPLGATGADP
jgi:hypothetical protein